VIEESQDEHQDELGFARSYDYFKYMTGVALLSLGGVFAFADGEGTQFERSQVIVLLAVIGIAGVTSLLMASALAGLEVKPEPYEQVVRRIRIGQTIVSMALSIGLGGFTYNFISVSLT
jgi:hypothetical protein